MAVVPVMLIAFGEPGSGPAGPRKWVYLALFPVWLLGRLPPGVAVELFPDTEEVQECLLADNSVKDNRQLKADLHGSQQS